MKHLIIVRGGGEMASGVIHTLFRAGYRVLVLEQAKPTAVRRTVSFSEAMYRGEQTVERVTCKKAKNLKEAYKRVKKGELIMIEDPKAECIWKLEPDVLIDAIVAHKNLGTERDMAKHTIALGPGFCAGQDVDAVVETMRGHNMGRLIFEGYSSKTDGISDEVSDQKEQLTFAPVDGKLELLRGLSSFVKAGEAIAVIHGKEGGQIEIRSEIDGVLRGAMPDDCEVKKGEKILDVHPTLTQADCYTISERSRCVGGAVLTAVVAWEHEAGKHSFFPSLRS